MELLRVFNNNVVLARSASGEEIILLGRGLGFQARPGQLVDETKVIRTFVPADGRDPDHLAQLLAEIPPEIVQLVINAMRTANLDDLANLSPTMVIALADHVSLAIKRNAQSKTVEYPLTGEVLHLYPEEYRKAQTLLSQINKSLEAPLPSSEATAFALHIVNVGFTTGDLSWTYTMTGVIQQILSVIEQTFGVNIDGTSVSAGRFITHLRYLFVRVRDNEQLEDHAPPIMNAIRTSYPQAYECARILAQLMELRLGERCQRTRSLISPSMLRG